jgi:signal transduction histidine kinase
LKESEDKAALPRFTVDTHLFRELGEYLVGRDSTALVELLKNAYDADATWVRVHAENLDSPNRGRIMVEDNGLGMTAQMFSLGFLRIASRQKEYGTRTSPHFGRRFTGAKGIGRLAAHKLAEVIEIESVAVRPKTLKPIEGIRASIDWRVVEQGDTLESIPDDAIKLKTFLPDTKHPGGTKITLRRLRQKWTARERSRFVNESQSAVPLPILSKTLPLSVLRKPLLFEEPRTATARRGGKSTDDTWSLELTGEFDVGEEYWQAVGEVAHWVLEIEAKRGSHQVRFGVAPTLATLREHPGLQSVKRYYTHPDPDNGPFFQARVLIRDGNVGAQTWREAGPGIRMYMEGFRVLPYGEPGNDWLELDREYARRSRTAGAIEKQLFPDAPDDPDVALTFTPNRNYVGAVFLTLEDAASLRMLVNREGFVPDVSFEHVYELVKGGIGLATRVRAAATYERRMARKEERRAGRTAEDPSTPRSPALELERAVDAGTARLKKARLQLTEGDVDGALRSLEQAQKTLVESADIPDEIRTEIAMVRVLASLGTQMASFVHEINGLLGLAESTERAIDSLLKEDLDRGVQRKLSSILKTVGDLRRALDRQASYLTDVASADARRRRSRQKLRAVFDRASTILEKQVLVQEITIHNRMSEDIKSPPMFRAELLAIFTNLLTNAIKAAGRSGTIVASARGVSEGRVSLRVENTGKSVDPSKGERWFKPFTSSSAQANPALGQGMGLGLPLTRKILDEYGATISFVAPSKGYASALEIVFPS